MLAHLLLLVDLLASYLDSVLLTFKTTLKHSLFFAGNPLLNCDVSQMVGFAVNTFSRLFLIEVDLNSFMFKLTYIVNSVLVCTNLCPQFPLVF